MGAPGRQGLTVKYYQLYLNMRLQETDDKGHYMSMGAFELTDTVQLGAKPFNDVLKLMADMHVVFENLPKENG